MVESATDERGIVRDTRFILATGYVVTFVDDDGANPRTISGTFKDGMVAVMATDIALRHALDYVSLSHIVSVTLTFKEAS